MNVKNKKNGKGYGALLDMHGSITFSYYLLIKILSKCLVDGWEGSVNGT